ncbi:recombinase zinc beta ribbon domain-containing protein [uncultured Paracoccus sp.]|uniref:recombinase zinc beta ribbon domain-containing protein n=1 Tax=uncultured Paracoccus sp. TaxID=189685 RepID=UPI00259310F0|nr:recombinase zinc beta ribbon domain-containing protein [uncultured Paracoccus sp.]
MQHAWFFHNEKRGPYSAISKDLIGCSTARNKGTCDNRMNIRRDELESRVLNALRTRLVDPELFAEFCDAYTKETNRLRMESGAGIEKAEAELKRIAREEEKLIDLYMRDAISIEAVKERGDKLRAQAADILRSLVEQVTLVPEEGELAIVLRGDLGAILGFAAGKKDPDFLSEAEALDNLLGQMAVSRKPGRTNAKTPRRMQRGRNYRWLRG